MNKRMFLIKEINEDDGLWQIADPDYIIPENELFRRLDEITEAPYDQDPAIMYEWVEILTTGGIGVKAAKND